MEEQDSESKIGTVGGVLSRFVGSDFVKKVRFRGPVGKLALVGVISVPSLCGVAIKSSNPTVQGLCAALATIVTLFVVGAILWYSHAHPDQATLEGMEVVILHQQKAWAAKGLTVPRHAEIVPDPTGIPPQLNPPEDPD
jgi:hypothetical protein